jgi:hypothetical protein
MTHRIAIVASLLAAATGTRAEVVSSAPNGFEVRSTRVVSASPEETWAMLGRIGEWWDSEHTYSGKASNMTLELKPDGCFCEILPNGTDAGKDGSTRAAGGVVHGRVLMAMPHLGLVLDSGLGPILEEGAAGRLKWSLRAVEGGTEVTQTYVVGGYVRGGADKLAPIVDTVLGQALERLQKKLAQ